MSGTSPRAGLAAELRELQLLAGKPTVLKIVKLTRELGNGSRAMARATLQDKLSGKTGLSLNQLLTLVEALELFAQREGAVIPPAKLNRDYWRSRWFEVVQSPGRGADTPDGEFAPAPGPSPVQFSTVAPAGIPPAAPHPSESAGATGKAALPGPFEYGRAAEHAWAARGNPLDAAEAEQKIASLSADGRLLATASRAGSEDSPGGPVVYLWDTSDTSRPRNPLPVSDNRYTNVMDVAFSPNGLLAVATGGKVGVWDISRRSRVYQDLDGKDAVAFSPDGSLLAAGRSVHAVTDDERDEHTVRVWETRTGAPVSAPLTGMTCEVRTISFGPRGLVAAGGGSSYPRPGEVIGHLWDLERGPGWSSELDGHQGPIRCMEFSPDGQLLATGGDDRTVRLWDTTRGTQLGKSLTGHITPVRLLAFSPDGKTLASAGDDDIVHLWSKDTSAELGVFPSISGGTILEIAFDPSGVLVAVTFDPGRKSLQMWEGTGATR